MIEEASTIPRSLSAEYLRVLIPLPLALSFVEGIKKRGTAIVVEPGRPNPERDAGSRAIVDFVEGLNHLGFDASLVLENDPRGLSQALNGSPDLVVLSRPGTFLRNIDSVNRARSHVAYFAHDLHFARMRAGIGLDSPFSTRASLAMEILEKRCMESADVVLVPTEEERKVVSQIAPSSNPRQINYYWFGAKQAPLESRVNGRVVFVGSRDHAPNSDGLDWFLNEIWGEIVSRLPEAHLLVVGDWADFLNDRVVPSVTSLGPLNEKQLDSVLDKCQLGISPLRYGAGMKRKSVHYLAHGLPLVTTTFGAQGLQNFLEQFGAGVVADSSREFGNAVVDLLQKTNQRHAFSSAAYELIGQHFDHRSFVKKLDSALT